MSFWCLVRTQRDLDIGTLWKYGCIDLRSSCYICVDDIFQWQLIWNRFWWWIVCRQCRDNLNMMSSVSLYCPFCPWWLCQGSVWLVYGSNFVHYLTVSDNRVLLLETVRNQHENWWSRKKLRHAFISKSFPIFLYVASWMAISSFNHRIRQIGDHRVHHHRIQQWQTTESQTRKRKTRRKTKRRKIRKRKRRKIRKRKRSRKRKRRRRRRRRRSQRRKRRQATKRQIKGTSLVILSTIYFEG